MRKPGDKEAYGASLEDVKAVEERIKNLEERVKKLETKLAPLKYEPGIGLVVKTED